MKKIHLILSAIAIALASVRGNAQNAWSARAPMLTPVTYAGGCVFSNQLYVFGGEYQAYGLLTDANQSYDPLSNTWTSHAPLPLVLEETGAVAVGGKIFVIGGSTFPNPSSPSGVTPTESGAVLVYDPVADAWSTNYAPMPVALSFPVVEEVNGLVYVISGYDHPAGAYYGYVQIYDPAQDKWTLGPSMPTLRSVPCGAVVGNGIYVMGGVISQTSATLNTVEELDTTTLTWTTKAPMPTARYVAGAAVLEGQIYVMGGTFYTSPSGYEATNVEIYDPQADSWSTGGPLPVGLSTAIAGTVSSSGTTPDTILITAGYSASSLPNPSGDTLAFGPPPTLTVTANPQTIIYGQADPALTYSVSGLQGSDMASTVLTGSLVRTPGQNAGTYAISQGTLAANANYTLVFIPSGLTITPATLTFTPNAVSTTYNGVALGDANYSEVPGNYSITGFQNGDNISSVNVTLYGSMAFNGLISTTVENVGSYVLTVGTLALSTSDGNYVLGFSNPSLNAYVIIPATLTVTANSLTKTYGSTDPTLTYGVGGLPGTDTASTVLTGSLVRSPGQDVGKYAISQGTLAANANYTISFVPGTLTVTEVPLTITWPANLVISTGGACSTANLPTPNIGTPTWVQNIPDVTVTSSRSDGQSQTAPYPVGITTITWTVTDVDDGGYSATYNQTVEVTDDVSISGNFNGTRIPAGSTIWFTAVLRPHLPKEVSGPVTIWFFAQNITSSAFNLAVPDATVVFDPRASLGSATCDASGRWTTRAPGSGQAGNTLLATYAYQLPPGQSLPGGLQPVKWDGTFATDTPGVTLEWQWSAAVYSQFGNCSNAGVKSSDDPQGDRNYKNSDSAGTPENYKLNVIGGGQGGGGSNCTGSPASTKTVVPCVERSAP